MYTVVVAAETSYARAVFAVVLKYGVAPAGSIAPPPAGITIRYNTEPAVPSLKST